MAAEGRAVAREYRRTTRPSRRVRPWITMRQSIAFLLACFVVGVPLMVGSPHQLEGRYMTVVLAIVVTTGLATLIYVSIKSHGRA